MSHPMRNPLTVEAAYGVKPKAGFVNIGMADVGMPENQHTFVDWIAYYWEMSFSTVNGINGYVAPTTDELQRLYDATTNEKGDPTKINPFLFKSMVFDLVLETPNDPRWDPFYALRDEFAKSSDSSNAIKQMFEDAKEGKEVTNVWLDEQVKGGTISESDLKDKPHDGRLPLPDGTAPGPGASGSTPTQPKQPEQPEQPSEPETDPLSDAIVELYIAYFNRAPEAEGFNYWKNVVVEQMEGGMSQGQAMAFIAEHFWPNAVAQGHVTGYSNSMSNLDFVSTIYANVLGRPDAPETDKEGVNYWTGILESGYTKGEVVMHMINAAHEYIELNDDAIADRTEAYLNNRLEVGRYFAQEKHSGHLTGEAAIIAGFNVTDKLTHEYSTVIDAIAEIDARSYSTTKLDGQETPIVNGDELSDSIVELYIAYFNRAPEAEGFNYWKNVVVEQMEGGMSQGQAMAFIAEHFWPNAVAQGHVTGYSDSMSNLDFVSTIYANVLGRPDAPETDKEGVNYWTGILESGYTKGEVVMHMINAAHEYIELNDDAIADRTEAYLNNRLEVGRYFAQEKHSGHLTGEAAIIAGFNVTDKLTHEYSTVIDAIAEIDARSYSTTVMDGQGSAAARTMSLDGLYEGDTLQFGTVQFNAVNDMDFNVLLEQGTAGHQPAALEVFDTPTELGVVGVDTYTDYDMFVA